MYVTNEERKDEAVRERERERGRGGGVDSKSRGDRWEVGEKSQDVHH